LVRQAIVSLYKLYGAFLADVYYLSVNPLHEPQLFELNPELGAVWSEELLTQLREIQDRCIAAYLEELRQQAGSKAEEQYRLTIVRCTNCSQKLRVPLDRGVGRFTCPKCKNIEEWCP
jgi:hypothetical protein